PPPPRPPISPYTTLFRSRHGHLHELSLGLCTEEVVADRRDTVLDRLDGDLPVVGGHGVADAMARFGRVLGALVLRRTLRLLDIGDRKSTRLNSSHVSISY